MAQTPAGIENELSFLVRTLPDLAGIPSAEIEQHYLDDGSAPLRLRRKNGEYELTRKLDVAPGDLSRKDERNLPLTERQFLALKKLSRRHLAKTRHYLPLPGGLTAELDVFHGPLEGLTMVEVEFPDEKARAGFVPPAWFGRDVSQEIWSANSFLAGKTFADIRGYL